MINGAIFWKTFRDSAPTVFSVAFAITAFVVLFSWTMLDMGTELMEFVAQFEFLKKIFDMALGIDVSGDISINVLFSVCFTHAMVLILSWSAIIATTSRVTAGEVERGTADLLLTLPVNRSEVYLSTSLVWLLATMLIAFCPMIGIWIGKLIFEVEDPVEMDRYLAPALNFFCLLFAVGGLSSLISSLINRRGLAVAVIAGFLFVSAVLNFVEPFLDAAQQIRFLGLLSYFRPVDIVRSGEWPIKEMSILLAIGLVCWLHGLWYFCRKDIPTG